MQKTQEEKIEEENYFLISVICLTPNHTATQFCVLHAHPPGSTFRQFYSFFIHQNKHKVPLREK